MAKSESAPYLEARIRRTDSPPEAAAAAGFPLHASSQSTTCLRGPLHCTLTHLRPTRAQRPRTCSEARARGLRQQRLVFLQKRPHTGVDLRHNTSPNRDRPLRNDRASHHSWRPASRGRRLRRQGTIPRLDRPRASDRRIRRDTTSASAATTAHATRSDRTGRPSCTHALRTSPRCSVRISCGSSSKSARPSLKI